MSFNHSKGRFERPKYLEQDVTKHAGKVLDKTQRSTLGNLLLSNVSRMDPEAGAEFIVHLQQGVQAEGESLSMPAWRFKTKAGQELIVRTEVGCDIALKDGAVLIEEFFEQRKL